MRNDYVEWSGRNKLWRLSSWSLLLSRVWYLVYGVRPIREYFPQPKEHSVFIFSSSLLENSSLLRTDTTDRLNCKQPHHDLMQPVSVSFEFYRLQKFCHKVKASKNKINCMYICNFFVLIFHEGNGYYQKLRKLSPYITCC